MFDTIKNIPGKIKNLWQGLSEKKRGRIVFLTIVLLIGISSLLVLINQKDYVVMYSGLDVYEAGNIYTQLTELNADVKMQNESIILIDKKEEEYFRMLMASEGYPKTGLNYDIYMNNVSVGVSDSEKTNYMIFQLQDRLQNTIKTLNGVNGAIVTISYPENDLFVLANEKKPVTASVVIDLGNSQQISASQIKAIENLVCGSISGLIADNVAIIDTNMNILNVRSNNDVSLTSDRYSLESELEREFENQILSMVEPIFGFDNVKVAASIQMNFDKLSQESTIFTPVIDEDGIVSTISEVKEQLQQQDGGTTAGGQDATSTNDTTKTETSTNYLVNQKFEVLEYEQGKIENIKVSILVNGEDLDQETLDNVSKIAAYAVGIDEQYVLTQAMPFSEKIDLDAVVANAAAQIGGSGVFSDTKFLLSLIAIVFGFILIMMILLVLKSGSKGKKHSKKNEIIEEEEEDLEELRAIKDPEKNYKNEIEKYVDKSPESVAELLKKWISED
ncbi:MAG: flagellar M-ring protein FliF [Clostridia bacterium]|nr:flagellar M-ring protein FliF [Clostridia bacterium]